MNIEEQVLNIDMNEHRIKIYDGIPDSIAYKYIMQVISNGKISKHKGKPCYCFVTLFPYMDGNICVNYCVNRKTTMFKVWKEKRRTNFLI